MNQIPPKCSNRHNTNDDPETPSTARHLYMSNLTMVPTSNSQSQTYKRGRTPYTLPTYCAQRDTHRQKYPPKNETDRQRLNQFSCQPRTPNNIQLPRPNSILNRRKPINFLGFRSRGHGRKHRTQCNNTIHFAVPATRLPVLLCVHKPTDESTEGQSP